MPNVLECAINQICPVTWLKIERIMSQPNHHKFVSAAVLWFIGSVVHLLACKNLVVLVILHLNLCAGEECSIFYWLHCIVHIPERKHPDQFLWTKQSVKAAATILPMLLTQVFFISGRGWMLSRWVLSRPDIVKEKKRDESGLNTGKPQHLRNLQRKKTKKPAYSKK